MEGWRRDSIFNPALHPDRPPIRQTQTQHSILFLLIQVIKNLKASVQLIIITVKPWLLRCYKGEQWSITVWQSLFGFYCMSTFCTISIVCCSILQCFLNLSSPYKVGQVSWWALSVDTVPLYVTDVTGATVGIEGEGLQAICPGSSFEKGW